MKTLALQLKAPRRWRKSDSTMINEERGKSITPKNSDWKARTSIWRRFRDPTPRHTDLGWALSHHCTTLASNQWLNCNMSWYVIPVNFIRKQEQGLSIVAELTSLVSFPFSLPFLDGALSPGFPPSFSMRSAEEIDTCRNKQKSLYLSQRLHGSRWKCSLCSRPFSQW